jgi:hypothetical protein
VIGFGREDIQVKQKSDAVGFHRLYEALEVGHRGQGTKLSDALDDTLKRVTEAVCKSGQKGGFTLKINVTQKSQGVVHIGALITTSLPEPKTFPLELFTDKKGRLLAEDPDQGKLADLEIVNGGGDE